MTGVRDASPPAVVALLAADAARTGLSAAFEEEGVPLRIEHGVGDALALARIAASASELGLGIGADEERLALVLAAAPGRVYLVSVPADARGFGHRAARLAARRPLPGAPTPAP
jgi:hypothetical protein